MTPIRTFGLLFLASFLSASAVAQPHWRYSYDNNLPPGLAKRNGNLPPGLQKHLYRNGHLPPGLEKRTWGYSSHPKHFKKWNRDRYLDRLEWRRDNRNRLMRRWNY